MADMIQHRYIMQISTRLERFTVKRANPYRMNFRCPVCGDSQTSKSKTRGWLSEGKNGKFWFSCFNCGGGLPFNKFLEHIDPMVLKEYEVDAYLGKSLQGKALEPDKGIFLENKKKKHSDPLSMVKKISQLPVDHPAKKYIENRQIPSDQHFKIYYTPKFKTWINKVDSERFPEVHKKGFKDEPRLLLPFIDQKGRCFGVSARSFDPNANLRYISIMFEERPKIFGLQSVDFTKEFYIVEGPIDSLFIPNAIAMAGADANDHDLPIHGIWTFDNEPRNKEIHKRMKKLMKNGRRVCLWPSNIKQKDINDMHLAGLRDIDKIISSNAYTGLAGELELTNWSKR